MKKVEIYIKKYCPYCRRALDLLDSKGIPFTKIEVAENEELFAQIKQQTGSNTVPQILIDGEFIGGCDDIHELNYRGELDSKLGLS